MASSQKPSIPHPSSSSSYQSSNSSPRKLNQPLSHFPSSSMPSYSSPDHEKHNSITKSPTSSQSSPKKKVRSSMQNMSEGVSPN